MIAREKPVDAEFIARQRKRLERLHARLGEMQGENIAAGREHGELHGDEAIDFEDEAQRLARNEVNQAIHDVDQGRLYAIERALTKIDEGTYGFSDASGAAIPRQRLEAVPEACLTVAEEEAREKRRR